MNKASPEMITLFKDIRISRILHEDYPSVNDPTGHYDEEINVNGVSYHLECDITEKDVKSFIRRRYQNVSLYA